MGWGTTINAEIYISRVQFENKLVLEDKISELEKNIEADKSKILMFCSANPKDVVPEEWKDEPIVFIYNNVQDIFDNIHTNETLLYELYLLKDNFDTRINH
jgi:hypothetical protein